MADVYPPRWLESEAQGRGWGPGRRDKLAVAVGAASRAANPDPGQGAGPLDSDVRPGPGQLMAIHGCQVRGLRAPRGTAHRTLPPAPAALLSWGSRGSWGWGLWEELDH